MPRCTPIPGPGGWDFRSRQNGEDMPQSLARVVLHTVFSTKKRIPFLIEPGFRAEVHAFLGACAKAMESVPIEIGGVADHVHLLTTLPRTIAIAEFVKELKRVSTNRIHMQRRDLEEFHWQAGYGIFSVSESVVPVVARYIRNQEVHHRASTYRAEYRTLLRKHGVVWDEAHVWD